MRRGGEGGDVADTGVRRGNERVRGVELAYEVRGRGPTLIWGHGLSSSLERQDDLGLLDWDSVAATLRLVRYDARGHGRSGDAGGPAELSWESLALDQLDLATAIGVGEYVAAGASMGSATALHAAVRAPDRVRALVLVTPPTGWGDRDERARRMEQGALLVEKAGVEAFFAASRDLPPPDPFVGSPVWTEAAARRVRSTDPTRLAAQLRGAAGCDLPDPDRVRAITAPTLVLAWTGDAVHPLAIAERLAEMIQGSELVVASSAVELAAWTDRVLAFVERVASADR